jgi:hypothetical protein
MTLVTLLTTEREPVFSVLLLSCCGPGVEQVRWGRQRARVVCVMPFPGTAEMAP